MNKGLVIKSTGSWYMVLADDGTAFECRAKGKIRLEGIRTTNPISVGDRVLFEEENESQGVITEIEKRKNYIIRRSVNLSKETQIIAANVDTAFLLVTTTRPQTAPGFIDRFLATAEAYSIRCVLLFSKCDQYNADEMQVVNQWMNMYRKVGYETLMVSTMNGQGVEELQALVKDKISLFSGQSGSGKSSLINLLIPGIDLRTGEVNVTYDKGKHTTTFAEMHPLPQGGFVIDTPGIKGFGLVDIPKEELHHYFKEFFVLLPQCRFGNCVHINEPGCAVKRGIETGAISPSRYKSYLNMYNDVEDEAYRND